MLNVWLVRTEGKTWEQNDICIFPSCGCFHWLTTQIQMLQFLWKDRNIYFTRWWFQTVFIFIRTLGKWSNLTCAYFSDGLVKNHQQVLLSDCFFSIRESLWENSVTNPRSCSAALVGKVWKVTANLLGKVSGLALAFSVICKILGLLIFLLSKFKCGNVWCYVLSQQTKHL